ncbi:MULTISPECIES: TniB family NTP-binding protein [Thalassospira]|uniref:AAA+ ATPase domain-containing protein n=1 Tax=Thalassospira profundimaris TaxID=502049 RepID=A0A367VK37_9PROT|nr:MULTISPECIES: TniB family NTP-binding protein [Thalassospira]KZB70812.1 hypothetical protein AUQ43_08095 [Thalassospira sp. MCCC 1A01148]RCK25553.1 hypothetical protein TH6_02780 [Thalassospira profundimaris]
MSDVKLLTKQQARQLAAFQNRRVHHSQFQQATARIANFHISGVQASAPGITTLVGETGAGKSSVIENFCSTANSGDVRNRVLSIVIPQSCTIKNLASRILHALGDPCATKGTLESMEQRITKIADHASVEMLIFDEFQHLTNKGSQARRYDSADWLKTQLEILRRPVLVAGLPEVNEIFLLNPQLATRRRARIELLPFDPSTKGGAKELLMLFHFMNMELPLPDPAESVLLKNDVMLGLARSCKGLIGSITKIIHRAVEIAMLSDSTTLTELHLQCALEELEVDIRELDTSAARPPQEVKRKPRTGRRLPKQQQVEFENGPF